MIKEIKAFKGRNIRSLSQYTNKYGKKIRENALIRSARIDRMSRKVRNNFLKKHSIKTVIDLRTAIEVAEGKDIIFEDDILYYHVPILDIGAMGISHERSMAANLFKLARKNKNKNYPEEYMISMYKSIVLEESSQKHFKDFFNILLKRGHENILFHCTGGKDRTGISALFIMTLLDFDYDKILLDYSQSDISNKKHSIILTTIMHLFLYVPSYKRLLIGMLHAYPKYLAETIKCLEEKFGSVRNYLREKIDIDDKKEQKLKELFLI